MSQNPAPPHGSIVWTDLTVDDADAIKDFYCDIVGWTATPHDMGSYSDFNIVASDGSVVTGICHARGTNTGVPPRWLPYFSVESVERSAARCVELGGRVIDGPRDMGGSRFCVIEDPAGAVAALIGG